MSLFNEADGLDVVCRHITIGRTLAHQLASALREYSISEAEFRVLWQLRVAELNREPAPQQSSLSTRLRISPAQVSAIVEKLRTQGIITASESSRDRRRRQWQLAPAGRQRFDAIYEVLNELSREWLAQCEEVTCSHRREEAA